MTLPLATARPVKQSGNPASASKTAANLLMVFLPAPGPASCSHAEI
jgi:hypothetical protein